MFNEGLRISGATPPFGSSSPAFVLHVSKATKGDVLEWCPAENNCETPYIPAVPHFIAAPLDRTCSVPKGRVPYSGLLKSACNSVVLGSESSLMRRNKEEISLSVVNYRSLLRTSSGQKSWS
ncbi:hypothetical protein Ancab_014545 [Ancistrocladus abbreviatus]